MSVASGALGPGGTADDLAFAKIGCRPFGSSYLLTVQGCGRVFQHAPRSAYSTAISHEILRKSADLVGHMTWNQAEAIQRLEADLGLPDGFVAELVNEDDWSFIVKSHALVEAALTHMLIAALRREELRDTIAKMAPRQKLGFGEALRLIDTRERGGIESLFAVRNLLAHNISYVQFKLKDYVASLNDERQRQLALSFHPYRGDDDTMIEIDGERMRGRDILHRLFRVMPKNIIHDAVVLMVALASERKHHELRKREEEMSLAEYAERLSPLWGTILGGTLGDPFGLKSKGPSS